MAVRVRGLRELLEDLEELASPDHHTDAALAAAQELVRDAGPRTPVRSGRLRSATVAHRDGRQVSVTNPLPYAGVIHNGWPAHHIAATPFVEDAADSDAWLDVWVDALEDR